MTIQHQLDVMHFTVGFNVNYERCVFEPRRHLRRVWLEWYWIVKKRT